MLTPVVECWEFHALFDCSSTIVNSNENCVISCELLVKIMLKLVLFRGALTDMAT